MCLATEVQPIQTQVLTVFEVPVLFKVNVTTSHFRPSVDFGASLRHIATIRDQTSMTIFTVLVSARAFKSQQLWWGGWIRIHNQVGKTGSVAGSAVHALGKSVV
jgi:hypothetical protein